MKQQLTILLLLIALLFASMDGMKAHAASNVDVVFEFNEITFQDGDVIELTIHVTNYVDLYGFQVDIKEDTPVFSFPTNTTTPYTVSSTSILSGGTTWLNAIDSLVASIIYTQDQTIVTGVDYTDTTELVTISFQANTDITNILDYFTVSNDYDDLTFGTANAIVKLSDSNGDPISYTYYQDTTAPVITGHLDVSINEKDELPDVLSGVTAVDDYDARNLTLYTNLEDIVDPDTPGEYTVFIWAYDIFGNKGEVSLVVSVLDITAPIITGPDTVQIQLTEPLPDFALEYTIEDNVDGTIPYALNMFDDTTVNYDQTGTYQATITATDTAGNETVKTISIIIVPIIHVETIAFEEEMMSLYPDDEMQLAYSISPLNALNQDVTFSMPTNDIITLTEDGLVVALRSGEVTITITTSDGGLQDTILIQVLLESPEFQLEPGLDTIYEGQVWTDEGCQAQLFEQSLPCQVESNNVGTTPGTYQVVYYALNSDGEKEYRTRTVTILPVEVLPNLELNSGIDTIKVNEEWLDAGCVQACTVVQSNLDTSKPGVYEIRYQLNSNPVVERVRYVYVYASTPYDQTNIADLPRKKEGDWNA